MAFVTRLRDVKQGSGGAGDEVGGPHCVVVQQHQCVQLPWGEAWKKPPLLWEFGHSYGKN